MKRAENNKRKNKKKLNIEEPVKRIRHGKEEIINADYDEENERNSKRKVKNESKDKKLTKKQIKEQKKQSKKEAKCIKKEERRKKIRKFIFKIFIIIILIVSIIGYLFYRKTEENGGGTKGALITVFGLSVEKVESLEPINILLLGISEDINSKLTDTIILCSYNPKFQEASMLSIPRDTFVGKNKETAKGSQKINSLYSKSPDKLLKTVKDITGVNVEYYIVVKNKALIEIVDILGGVKFDVPIDMNYDDPTQDLHIHLKRGVQKIDGEKAEQLLRFRHNNDGSSYPANYGDNDYGRMKTQRNFINETIKQTLVVKNIPKSKKIIDTIFANIETNLELENLIPYLPTAVDFNPELIVSNQLPGKSEKCNDLWFFIHNKKETNILIKELGIK